MKLAAALTGAAALELGTPLKIVGSDMNEGVIEVAEDVAALPTTETAGGRSLPHVSGGSAPQFFVKDGDGEWVQLRGVQSFDISATAETLPKSEDDAFDCVRMSSSFDCTFRLWPQSTTYEKTVVSERSFEVRYGDTSIFFDGVLTYMGTWEDLCEMEFRTTGPARIVTA